MKRTEIDSTCIREASYNPVNKRLRLKFPSGSWYEYHPVPHSIARLLVAPPEERERLLETPSIGVLYNTLIRGNPSFTSRQIPPRTRAPKVRDEQR